MPSDYLFSPLQSDSKGLSGMKIVNRIVDITIARMAPKAEAAASPAKGRCIYTGGCPPPGGWFPGVHQPGRQICC